jgi:hypothetical protein
MYSVIADLNNYKLAMPNGWLRLRILAKVCNPDSVVGNFANSDQNGRTVRKLNDV